MNITASNLVKAIERLPKNRWFEYISERTRTQVRVVSVDGPEGPIAVERRNPVKADPPTKTYISSAMLWRVANAIRPTEPFNLDRVLAGSYNNRSSFETLLAHTPEFYWCVPGRIELINGLHRIKEGHKHLVWLPGNPHANGVLTESEENRNKAISEIPPSSVTYESLILPSEDLSDELDIDIKRRHLQIQVALVEIGVFLGFRSWVAHNDKGFRYGDKRVGELNGVVASLKEQKVLSAYDDAIKAGQHIDCIWFKNGSLMPAVFEVEHSTGVTSGLSRLQRFHDLAPPLKRIRWVIVAADEDRNEVLKKAGVQMHSQMDVKYFPYSAVEELHWLCRKRNLSEKAVTENFLDCYMESCAPNLN
jgi:type II restriction enzyme